ncbi:MAG TPA: hypothetical protein C5S50_00865 [Methanosarcinaceae archaeon]|nr:hypothetical protein [Methanosarcinaceae archaeon]
MGILEEDTVVDINAFSELVADISDTLSGYSNLLKEVSEKKKITNNFKDIKLSDNKYFDLFIGKRILKKDIINISGNIPIYSANVKIPVGYHNQSNIQNFENNFVLWGIDGDFVFNTIQKNNPFVSTDHCGTIRILKNKILPEYLMIQLENVKHKYGFDRELRASLKNMGKVTVQIPFNNNDAIDIEKQQEIIEKYECINELKERVGVFKKQINKLIVEIELSNYNFINCAVTDENIFCLMRGKRITKETIYRNKGNIPVYSSSKSENSVLGHISEKYIMENNLTLLNEPSILFNLDGSVGYCFLKNDVKYSFIDVVASFKPKVKNIDLEYLLYKLREEIHKTDADYQSKLYFNKINNYGISINIPINKKGEFDIEAQKQIAEKYRKIEDIKYIINNELDKIKESVIGIE